MRVHVQTDASWQNLVAHFRDSWSRNVYSKSADEHHVDVEQLKRFRVRCKPMDHLSLAYLRDVSMLELPTAHDGLSMQVMDELYHEALKTIKMPEQELRWSIALHELTFKSHSVHTMHEMPLIRRWYI